MRFHRIVCILGLIVIPTTLYAQGPTLALRQGLWKFDRTISAGGNPHMPNATFATGSSVTRCVDPSLAVWSIFNSGGIAACVPEAARQLGPNRWLVPRRCDYFGPARTELIVQGESAYTEINTSLGEKKTVETIIARRIGDCD